jgi:hypothetical protein
MAAVRQQEEDDIMKLLSVLFGGRGRMLRDMFMASLEARRRHGGG